MSTSSIAVALFSVFLLFLEPVSSVHVFDVYRMFQLERANVPLGSQRVMVNSMATTLSKKGNLGRYIVLLPFEQVNLEALNEILQERTAAALLILLPPTDQSISAQDIEKWKGVEEEMVKNQYLIPIYFTRQDAIIKEVYDEIAKVSESGGIAGAENSGFLDDLFGSLSAATQYQFVVSGSEGAPVKDVSITNLQGSLTGVQTENVPTIAVVAYYDTFAAAPGLATSGGSGVVALLELARLYGKLYDNSRTHGRYNILFVLSGAGIMNFAGTKNWLTNTDVRLLETIEFVLCLDSIGNGDQLYFHVSRIPKEENTQKLYDGFKRTAQDMGINFEIVHKKVNLSDPDVAWEHEQFSRKKIVAATLSSRPTPPEPLARSHILENKINTKTLVRDIKFIGESLAKHIYGFANKELQVFEGSLEVNTRFVDTWIELITSSPRVAPYTPKKSLLVSSLEKVLQLYTDDVATQTFTLDNEWTFYDVTQTTISTYKTKPSTFDLLLTVCIAVYLTGLYALVRGLSEAINDFKSMFASQSKKVIKKKSQ